VLFDKVTFSQEGKQILNAKSGKWDFLWFKEGSEDNCLLFLLFFNFFITFILISRKSNFYS